MASEPGVAVSITYFVGLEHGILCGCELGESRMHCAPCSLLHATTLFLIPKQGGDYELVLRL